MTDFLLSAAAANDLREIWEHIAEDSLDAAERVLDELEAAMTQLADMPGLGHVRRDLASESLRFWTVYSYLIVCRPDSSPLQVVRVLSGYRDIAALLDGE